MSAARESLTGARILLTRSAEDSAAWAKELERLGAEPLVLPCITTMSLDTPELRRELAAQLGHADWLALTSRRGVEATAALLAAAGAAVPRSVRIATVGEATGAAAREAFGRADLVGGGTAAALAAALVHERHAGVGTKVLLAVAANAREVLERELAAAGAECTRLAVYRTVPEPPREQKRRLSALGADAVVLASPSALTGFLNQVEVDKFVPIYTIGPATTEAARTRGLTVAGEAREPSLAALLEAIQCGI